MLRWKNRKSSVPKPGKKGGKRGTAAHPPVRRSKEEKSQIEEAEKDDGRKSPTESCEAPPPPPPPKPSPTTIGVVLPELPRRQSELTALLQMSHPAMSVSLPSPGASHADQVLVAVCGLWRQKRLNDAVLAIGPHRVGAHKLVLAACSGYFQDLFTKEEEEGGEDGEEFIYKLHGISVETLRLLLDSMYTGELPVDAAGLEEILSAAVYLKLPHALRVCCDFMVEHLETSTCLRTLGLATVFGLADVAEEASRVAAANFAATSETRDFLDLPERPLRALLTRDDLAVVDCGGELGVFRAVLRWVDASREARLGPAAASLLGSVRLPMIGASDLVDHVESVDYLMADPACEALVREALHYYCLPLRQCILQSGRTVPRSSVRLSTVVALGGQPRRAKDPVGDSLTYYNPQTNEWRVLTKMIQPRHHHAAAVLGGFLYVAGGREVVNGPHGPMGTAHRYDPRTDSWLQIADMNSARESFQMGVLDGMIYAVGGRESSESSLAAVERYNPSTDQWEERAPLSSPRRCVAVAVHDGKLYAVGGSGNQKVSSKVECYSPGPDAWESKRDLAVPRFFGSLCSAGEHLYLAGGATAAPGQGVRCLGPVERYDPRADAWTPLARPLAQPRAEAACCCVAGRRIYVLGGYCWDSKAWLRSAECFDTEADEWLEGVADFPHAFTGMACCCLTLHKLP